MCNVVLIKFNKVRNTSLSLSLSFCGKVPQLHFKLTVLVYNIKIVKVHVEEFDSKREAAIDQIKAVQPATELPPAQSKLLKEKYLGLVKVDEYAFTVALTGLIGSAWLVGAYPWIYWCYHAIYLTILLSYKLYVNKLEKKQWYLIDYCYIVNYLMVIYFLLCAIATAVPSLSGAMKSAGPLWFRFLFTASTGPLTLSIITLRNSLVFHDWNVLAVFMLHFSPNLAMWGMRWWSASLVNTFPQGFSLDCPGNENLTDQHIWSSFFGADDCRGTFFHLWVVPVIVYAAWCIPYSAFIFCFGARWLERRDFHTVYKETKDTPLFKKLLAGEEKYKPIKYMSIHFVSVSLATLVGPLLWHSFLLHTLYMIIMLIFGVYNGSTYYFRVFAKAYYAKKMALLNAKEVEVHTENQEEGEKDDGISKNIEMNALEGGVRITE